MSQRLTLFILIIALTGSINAGNQKPNIVFILIDDLGWTDLACYGSDYYQTPNIDALADKGVVFTQAYSACTVCSPTRAAILTGKYPASLKCTDYIPGKYYPYAKLNVPDWTMYLDTAETTLPEICRTNSYVTAHIGKWHLGDEECYWPEQHGFDINIGGWAKGAPVRHKKKGYNGYFSPYGNPRIKESGQNEYLTERLANEACRFIENNKNKPFFLNYWLYGVHLPLQARDNKIKKYERLVNNTLPHKNATYAAMVEHMDEAVGKVINTLAKNNLLENTIIVLTSDNGGLIGNASHHKQKITGNFPLRSGKGDMYEGGIRVPCIIAYDGIVEPRKSDELICSPDFLPTIIDLANLRGINTKQMDGISLHNLLVKQKALKSRALFWHYPHYHNEGAVPYSAIRLGDHKLIHNIEAGQYELYNLKDDLTETHNLIDSDTKIAGILIKNLETWKKKVRAQVPTTNPEHNPLRSKEFQRATPLVNKGSN